MTATFDGFNELLGARADGIGRYAAFGLVIEGPRRYLDGHCHPAPEVEQHDDGTPDVNSVLSIEVTHGLVSSPPELWRELIRHDAQRAAHAGHRFLRVLAGENGMRRFEMIGQLAVDADPNSGRLRVHAPATMHPDSLGSFITGTAMLCYFKAMGRLCLHAAVACKEKESVLICGPSGAGKSSLAAALNSLGWSIVVEDLAVVEVADGFVVRPGYGRLRLWSDSVEALLLNDQTSQIVVGADKHYLNLSGNGSGCNGLSSPLSAVVFLGPRLAEPAATLSLEPLPPSPTSIARLYANSLATYANTADQARTLLTLCRHMVDQIRIFELRLADDWSRLDQACREFERQLRHTAK